jgi:hypothetical protein
MSQQPQKLHAIRDRETLVRHSSGLEIIRAMKHEPISFAGMNDEELRRKTDKNNGSKFASDWTLSAYCAWLTQFLDVHLDWRFPPSQQRKALAVLDRPIGVADGKITRTIEVVARGRYVHAYPVVDR